MRSSSLRKSYSSFADQFPAIAHSTPAPTTQPLFLLDALIELPVVQIRDGGIIVDPSSAGLAIKQHAVVKHYAEPRGQR